MVRARCGAVQIVGSDIAPRRARPSRRVQREPAWTRAHARTGRRRRRTPSRAEHVFGALADSARRGCGDDARFGSCGGCMWRGKPAGEPGQPPARPALSFSHGEQGTAPVHALGRRPEARARSRVPSSLPHAVATSLAHCSQRPPPSSDPRGTYRVRVCPIGGGNRSWRLLLGVGVHACRRA
jgi:hypothetical protein